MSSLTCGAWLFCDPYPAESRRRLLTFRSNDTTPASSVRRLRPRSPPTTKASTPGREFFVSWGYNGDSYTKSDIHFSQPSLGNDFTLVGVQVRDSKAWTDVFSHSLIVPQYNVRFGIFFNEKWGVELALDHIKWIVRQDQTVAHDRHAERRARRHRGRADAGCPALSAQQRRQSDLRQPDQARTARGRARAHRLAFSFCRKRAAGSRFRTRRTRCSASRTTRAFSSSRAGTWTPPPPSACTSSSRLYFEFEEKLLYARYFGVKIDRGTARHSVKAAEFSLHFGVAFR